MKKNVMRQKWKARKFKNQESDRTWLKMMSCNKILGLGVRGEADVLLSDSKGISVVRKVCVKTGRSRGVVKKVKLSRLAFRREQCHGELCGIRKSSW